MIKSIPPATIGAPENFSYSIGEYRVFRIVPSDPESMTFLSQLHVRSLEFCDKYQSDTDPVWLAQLLFNNFKNPQTANLVHLLVATDVSEEIVGHSIAFTENYGKLGAVATLLQWEYDRELPEGARGKIHGLGLSLVKEWAKSLGIKTLIAYVIRAAMARMIEVDNFYQYRVVMRHDLGD